MLLYSPWRHPPLTFVSFSSLFYLDFSSPILLSLFPFLLSIFDWHQGVVYNWKRDASNFQLQVNATVDVPATTLETVTAEYSPEALSASIESSFNTTASPLAVAAAGFEVNSVRASTGTLLFIFLFIHIFVFINIVCLQLFQRLLACHLVQELQVRLLLHLPQMALILQPLLLYSLQLS